MNCKILFKYCGEIHMQWFTIAECNNIVTSWVFHSCWNKSDSSLNMLQVVNSICLHCFSKLSPNLLDTISVQFRCLIFVILFEKNDNSSYSILTHI